MKKLLAISLAFILLVSNVGITLATHLCGGQAVKSRLMVGQDHLQCGMTDMDMSEKQEPDHKSFPDKQGCCENHYLTLEVDDDYQTTSTQFSLQLNFVIASLYSFLYEGLLQEEDSLQYASYSPPILLRDISVFNQVFII